MLAFDIGEVGIVVEVVLFEVERRDGGDLLIAAKVLEGLPQVAHAIDGDAVDKRGFCRVFFWDEDGRLPSAVGFDGDREDAVDSANAAIERPFADDARFGKHREVELLGGGNHAKGDGETPPSSHPPERG